MWLIWMNFDFKVSCDNAIFIFYVPFTQLFGRNFLECFESKLQIRLALELTNFFYFLQVIIARIYFGGTIIQNLYVANWSLGI